LSDPDPDRVPPAANSVFASALLDLGEGDGVSIAMSFRDYARGAGLDARRATPEYISVDSYGRLAKSLREASTMVFRLGEAEGTGTQFSLVRVAGRLRDFFVFDDDVFTPETVRTYLPEASSRALFPFALLDTAVEANLVNFAFATGLIGQALDLDQPPPIPACGRGRYSFDFRPHSSLPGVLHHRSGQVEVDALFTARRGGRQELFVIEAKVGNAPGSLSLHKLAYPCMAFRGAVPTDMPIVPVYLKIGVDGDGITYNVARFEPIARGDFVIDSMRVEEAVRLRIPSRRF
jgi:hypothetical protein